MDWTVGLMKWATCPHGNLEATALQRNMLHTEILRLEL